MSVGFHYEVLEVLGAGGFGTVYRARFVGEGGFAKEVALKVLNPEVEGVGEVAERLRDEARILGLLRHRAIVQVDRLTQIEGRWTVVMEYVEGQDLSKVLKRGPMPPGPALEVVAEVAGALHAAYSRPGPGGQPLRLLHRDLKPPNIRVTPFGEVKVLDFGIARAEFDAREANTRSLAFGTPPYMSPERLDLQPDGPAGDVYAVGVILYEMLSGEKLGKTSANPALHDEKIRKVLATMARARVPEPIVQLTKRCLDYAPEARPAASALESEALALARQLRDEPLRSWAARALVPGDRVPDPEVGTQSLSLDLTGALLRESEVSASTPWEATPARSERTPQPKLVPGRTTMTPLPTPSATLWQPKPEQTTGVAPTPPETPRPRPVEPRTAWGRSVGFVVAPLVLVGFVGGLWALGGNKAEKAEIKPALAAPASVAETDEVEPPARVEEVPVPALPPEPPSGPSLVPSARELERPASASKVEPRVPVEPKTTAPTKVRVTLVGDVTRARLDSPDGCALPCSVLPGEHLIYADFGFDDQDPFSFGGKVQVPAAEVVQIHCDTVNARCKVEK